MKWGASRRIGPLVLAATLAARASVAGDKPASAVANRCDHRTPRFANCEALARYRVEARARFLASFPGFPVLYDALTASEPERSRLLAQYEALSDERRLLDARRSLALLGARAAEKVQAHLDHDRQVVFDELRQREIDRLAMVDADLAVASFVAHIVKALRIVRRAHPERFQRPDFYEYYYSKWFRTNVAAQLGHAYSTPATGRQGFRDALVAVRGDVQRLTFLADRAATRDVGQEFDGNLTPYYARMVLLYHLARQLSPDERDALARSLRLGFYLMRPPSGWATFVPHDGFLIGGTAENVSTLFGEDEPTNTGSDCAQFITYVLAQLDVPEPSIRAQLHPPDSGGPGLPDGNFERRAICSEDELEPGDIISGNTHHQIFVGYTNDPMPVPVVAEARGGDVRTIRVTTAEVWNLDVAHCARTFFVAVAVQPYRVRLMRAPSTIR